MDVVAKVRVRGCAPFWTWPSTSGLKWGGSQNICEAMYTRLSPKRPMVSKYAPALVPLQEEQCQCRVPTSLEKGLRT